jgi:thiol:disulfide interchange protein
MLFPSWSVDQKLTVEVKSVDLAGRKAVLRIKPAKETENAYFMRVAMARQTPEERTLKLDPMRPKADAESKVKWLEHKDGARYALRIANSPNVQKRVLLDFTGPRCIWCARMYKYTFTDREVMQLTEKFVCAKIAFRKGAGDTKKYDVEGTPTYIILALDGSEIARQVGFLRPTEFAAWIKAALR